MRNIFRHSPGGNSATRRTIRSGTSKLRKKAAVSSKLDGEESGLVKHALSIGSLFSRRTRRSQLKNDVSATSGFELREESEEASTTDSARPDLAYDGLALATASLDSPDGPQRLSLGIGSSKVTAPMRAPIAGETSSTTSTSSTIAGIVQPQAAASGQGRDPESGHHITSASRGPGPSAVSEPSLSHAQLLPPVVPRLQLDLPTPRALHGTQVKATGSRWPNPDLEPDDSVGGDEVDLGLADRQTDSGEHPPPSPSESVRVIIH
ncbi:unnamed protein product [Echinostoma caproni]|uniref:Uncharacterized protein n=1 Tax=Echinostoma caproni TaxID=27848 RepID=A0A3P8C1S2_9TREM|nr:unnamed protein product [Echinostoma caproni]